MTFSGGPHSHQHYLRRPAIRVSSVSVSARGIIQRPLFLRQHWIQIEVSLEVDHAKPGAEQSDFDDESLERLLVDRPFGKRGIQRPFPLDDLPPEYGRLRLHALEHGAG